MKSLIRQRLFENKLVSNLSALRFNSQNRLKSCKLIDGKGLANKYLDNLKREITKWTNDGNKTPHLSVILVEGSASSQSYVNMKCKAAKLVGITTEVLTVSKRMTQKDLINVVVNMNQSPTVDGILVQLPLSPHMDIKEVCNTISPEKDVDGFTPDSLGKLCINKPSFVPCTALAVHQIISSLGINMTGKRAVICGRSKHVGLPIALVLHSSIKLGEMNGLNMSTTICHKHTPADELFMFARNADVLITAVGQQNLIRGSMVKPGAVVVDVGFVAVTDEEGKRHIVGDVNMDEVQKVAGMLSPVPGGVGPVTVAMLMANTFLAAKHRAKTDIHLS